MYKIKIYYITDKTDELECQDYFYDNEYAIDTITFEITDIHRIDVMLHQVRKIDIVEDLH